MTEQVSIEEQIKQKNILSDLQVKLSEERTALTQLLQRHDFFTDFIAEENLQLLKQEYLASNQVAPLPLLNLELMIIDRSIELIQIEEEIYLQYINALENIDAAYNNLLELNIDNNFIAVNTTGIFEYQFSSNGSFDIKIIHNFVFAPNSLCSKIVANKTIKVTCSPEPDCEEAECDGEVAFNLATALIDNFDYQSSACIASISGIPMPDCYEAFMIWDDGTVEQIPENGRINHAYLLSRLTRNPRIEIRLANGELCYSTDGIAVVRCNSQVRPGNESSFTLSPNPTQNEFKIFNENTEFQSVDVSIYDIRGKLHFSKNITSNETINVNGYLKGIYIVKIMDEKGIIQNLKLIIE